jgi:hypothetical protein
MRGGGGVTRFGKWFMEKNFVNHFPIFIKAFSGQRKTFVVDFYFTTKQTPANDGNVLRKMFYIETNGALFANEKFKINAHKV